MQFARDHPEINVVGVGAGHAANGDSLEGAYEFVSNHKIGPANMTMLYDNSFRAWQQFGVFNQPWVILFDADGIQFLSQPGRIKFDTVTDAFEARRPE